MTQQQQQNKRKEHLSSVVIPEQRHDGIELSTHGLG